MKKLKLSSDCNYINVKKIIIYFSIAAIMAINSTSAALAKNHEIEVEKNIEEYIDKLVEEQYIRIPKNDFDIIIDNKVTSVINSKLDTIIAFSLALIGILSALSIIQTKRTRDFLKDELEANININLKNATIEIRKYYEDEMDRRVVQLKEQFHKALEENKNARSETLIEIQKQIKQAQQQVDKSKDYLLNLEFQILYEKIITRASQGENIDELEQRTINLLEDAESKEKNPLMPKIVNLLSAIYYDQEKYNEVIQLISKYETNFKLEADSYINAALTALNDYHNFNSVAQRDKAIEYLDKSLELTRGYGQAQALKLEIVAIDYLRSEEDEEKRKNALDNGKIIFTEIINSASPNPAIETVNRLKLDSKTETTEFKIYVDTLNDVFPQEMTKLEEIFDEFVESQEIIDELTEPQEKKGGK